MKYNQCVKMTLSLVMVLSLSEAFAEQNNCLNDNGKTVNEKINGDQLQDVRSFQLITKSEAHQLAAQLPGSYKKTAEMRIDQPGVLFFRSVVDVKYDKTHKNELLVLLGEKDCSTHAAYKVSSLPEE